MKSPASPFTHLFCTPRSLVVTHLELSLPLVLQNRTLDRRYWHNTRNSCVWVLTWNWLRRYTELNYEDKTRNKSQCQNSNDGCHASQRRCPSDHRSSVRAGRRGGLGASARTGSGTRKLFRASSNGDVLQQLTRDRPNGRDVRRRRMAHCLDVGNLTFGSVGCRLEYAGCRIRAVMEIIKAKEVSWCPSKKFFAVC